MCLWEMGVIGFASCVVDEGYIALAGSVQGKQFRKDRGQALLPLLLPPFKFFFPEALEIRILDGLT